VLQLPEAVVSKLLALDAGDLDLMVQHPLALQGQVYELLDVLQVWLLCTRHHALHAPGAGGSRGLSQWWNLVGLFAPRACMQSKLHYCMPCCWPHTTWHCMLSSSIALCYWLDAHPLSPPPAPLVVGWFNEPVALCAAHQTDQTSLYAVLCCAAPTNTVRW
jgi:hypothetical protein